MLDQDLPIKVKTQDLFETGDKASGYLLSKLEAWVNFQTLAANWFADEDFIIDLTMTLLPETSFLDLQVDSTLWQTIQLASFTAVYMKQQRSVQAYIMLSNDELNTAMTQSAKVESLMQDKLRIMTNIAAKSFSLPSI